LRHLRTFILFLFTAFSLPVIYAQTDAPLSAIFYSAKPGQNPRFKRSAHGNTFNGHTHRCDGWSFSVQALLLYPKTGLDQSFSTSFGIGFSILKSISDTWKSGAAFKYIPLSSIESTLDGSDVKSDASLTEICLTGEYTLFQEFLLSAFAGRARYIFNSSGSVHDAGTSVQGQDYHISGWHWVLGFGPSITVIKSTSFELSVSMQYYTVLTNPHSSYYFLGGLRFAYLK